MFWYEFQEEISYFVDVIDEISWSRRLKEVFETKRANSTAEMKITFIFRNLIILTN